MPKNIVFICRRQDKLLVGRLIDPFVESGWYVYEVESVAAARKIPKIDLLVVLAYGEFFIKKLRLWIDRPRTAWVYIPNEDHYLEGPKLIHINFRDLTPKKLYTRLCK